MLLQPGCQRRALVEHPKRAQLTLASSETFGFFSAALCPPTTLPVFLPSSRLWSSPVLSISPSASRAWSFASSEVFGFEMVAWDGGGQRACWDAA